MENQLTLFDFIRPEIIIDKPIRLIELFAGYGSQALALEYLGVDFEHYRAVEFDKYAIASYNAIHDTDFPVMDVTKISGKDLGIINKSEFTVIPSATSKPGTVLLSRFSWVSFRSLVFLVLGDGTT